MNETKTIRCPQCRKDVIHYDGKTTMNLTARCKKCRKLVVYHPNSGRVEIKEIPPRVCSSGMTFY